MESLWHDANGFNEFRFILVWFGSLVAMLGIVAGMVQFPRMLLRRRIREVIPDATDIRFGFVGSNKILFNYKGFRAELQLFGLKHRYLENNSNYTVEDISSPQQTADTHLRIDIPVELQKALTAARFQMVFTPDVFLLSTEVRPVGPKQCAIRTSNPIMQALTRDEEVLRTLTALQSVTRQRNVVISLRRDFFSVELPDTTNTDERALMTACGVRIFERVLAAAGAVNPAICSMPPIAGNFTINPDEFADKAAAAGSGSDDLEKNGGTQETGEAWTDEDSRSLPAHGDGEHFLPRHEREQARRRPYF